jgi:hypothetical protein
VRPSRAALQKNRLLPQKGEVTRAGEAEIQPPDIQGRRTVEQYVANERARCSLDDVMVRRTSWHYYHPMRRRKLERAADWIGLKVAVLV